MREARFGFPDGEFPSAPPPDAVVPAMAPTEHGKSPNHPRAVDKRVVHLVKGSKVEATSKVEGYVGAWFAATVIKPPEMANSKFRAKRMAVVEYCDLLNKDSTLLLREMVDAKMLRPAPPRVEDNGGFEVGDAVDAFHLDGWWVGKVDRVVREERDEELSYVVKFPVPEHEIGFEKNNLRLHLDWIDGKWFLPRNGKAQELVIQEDGRAILPINDGCNDRKELVIHKPAPSPSNEDSTHFAAMMSPPLSSSWHQRIMDAKRPAKKQKGTAEEPSMHASGKTAEFSSTLRKGNHGNESGRLITSASPGKNDSIIRAKRTKRRAGRYKGIQDALIDDDASEDDDVHNDLSSEQQLQMVVRSELTLAKWGEPQGTDFINDPPMQELALVAVGTELNPKEQGQHDLVKNEKASPLFEGTAVVPNKQQQTATNDISTMGPPFQRSVPIWDTLESMEIFRKFPQQPHFLPLMKEKERFREGLAIAKMVTFASTAESAINLSIDNDTGTFVDCLEALETLESYGFEAETLKHRLNKSLWLKEMQRKVEEDKNVKKGRVSELKHEIVEVKEEIHESARKLKFYRDKLKLALLKEEKKSLEVFFLETRLDVLDMAIRHARSEFEASGGSGL